MSSRRLHFCLVARQVNRPDDAVLTEYIEPLAEVVAEINIQLCPRNGNLNFYVTQS